MDYFAGLDVSVKATSVCIVDDTGKIVREVKVASEPEALLAALKNPVYHFRRIGLEAGPLSQWLYSALRRCSCADSRRNAPAPLDFRAPLAPESCARALDFEIGDDSLRIASRGLGSTYRLLSFGKIGIVTHSSSPKRHADRCETWWSSHSYLINQSILTVIVSP